MANGFVANGSQRRRRVPARPSIVAPDRRHAEPDRIHHVDHSIDVSLTAFGLSVRLSALRSIGFFSFFCVFFFCKERSLFFFTFSERWRQPKMRGTDKKRTPIAYRSLIGREPTAPPPGYSSDTCRLNERHMCHIIPIRLLYT